MKPHIVAHMMTSLDGHIDLARWSGLKGLADGALGTLYEDIHRRLAGDAWLVGRATMEEFADGKAGPADGEHILKRVTFKGEGAKAPYAVGVDAHGKLAWSGNTANGDHVVMVLTEAVPDAHLTALEEAGVSYLFAGQDEVDLDLALTRLHDDFGIARLLLEGGGHINGGFAIAGLIDELSLLVAPVIDGFSGAPTVFQHDQADARPLAMRLTGSETLTGGVLWLRYERAAQGDNH